MHHNLVNVNSQSFRKVQNTDFKVSVFIFTRKREFSFVFSKTCYNESGDNMTIRDVLNPEELFHPNIFYDGEWLLGGEFSLDAYRNDYLLLNALHKNGQNAYEQFLDENYYKHMMQMIKSRSVARTFFPKIALGVDATGNQRAVSFSISFFIYQQLAGLLDHTGAMERFSNFVNENSTVEDWMTALKKEIRADRSKYNDVIAIGRKSPYFDEIYQIFLDYNKYSKDMLTFPSFLEKKVAASTDLLLAARHYPAFFAKEINTKKLMEAFKDDTFFLIAARSALDSCEVTEQRTQLVDNAIIYVKQYLDAVEKMRQQNPNYNASMLMEDATTGKVKKITIKDIEEEFHAILARHPEFSFIKASVQDITTLLKTQGLGESEIASFDTSLRGNQEMILELLEKLRKDKDLIAEWTILPKGKATEGSKEGISPHFSTALPENEKVRRMIIGREYLENSPYLYRLSGMNKFEGYIAYIYANGSVIFEKYYENIKTKKVASSSATYVMDIYNFLEMSRLSKTEIIQLLHQDATAKVKRIFHREDMDIWMSDVERSIRGNDYSQEVKDYITTLLTKEEIKKRGVNI